jgi:RHS repeat-associated protein
VAVVTQAAGAPAKALVVHVDNLGSLDVLTNEAGGEEERRSYDAFGTRRNPIWGAPNPASFSSKAKPGFTGHESDDELGLVNMKGRIYDPKVGRFLTPDPIVSMPHFSQSWNPYSYVLNSPLAYVDPSGFSVVVAEDAPPTSLGEGEAWPPVAGSIDIEVIGTYLATQYKENPVSTAAS